jgi:hypothetical protein
VCRNARTHKLLVRPLGQHPWCASNWASANVIIGRSCGSVQPVVARPTMTAVLSVVSCRDAPVPRVPTSRRSATSDKMAMHFLRTCARSKRVPRVGHCTYYNSGHKVDIKVHRTKTVVPSAPPVHHRPRLVRLYEVPGTHKARLHVKSVIRVSNAATCNMNTW